MGYSLRSRLQLPALAAAAVLLAVPAFAQEQGVAHPEALNDDVAASPAASEHYQPKHAVLSAEAPVTTPAIPPETAPQPALSVRDAAAVPYPVAASAPVRRPVDESDASTWPTGIVTEVPDTPNTLLDGTLFRARLDQTLDTRTTANGTIFTARLVENVGHHGQVLLPAGSVIRGRVTDVHGGKRIGGAATLRLTPEFVELPDGRQLRLSAQVAGLDDIDDSRVNGEGVVVAHTDGRVTAAAFGLATGTGAVVGAMLGAGVGAVVGAGIGAGVSTVVWLKREHQEALPAGTQITFCLRRSLRLDDVAPGR